MGHDFPTVLRSLFDFRRREAVRNWWDKEGKKTSATGDSFTSRVIWQDWLPLYGGRIRLRGLIHVNDLCISEMSQR